MVSYEIKCPTCEKSIDSHDSYADTKAELREHLAQEHGQQEVSAQATAKDDFTVVMLSKSAGESVYREQVVRATDMGWMSL